VIGTCKECFWAGHTEQLGKAQNICTALPAHPFVVPVQNMLGEASAEVVPLYPPILPTGRCHLFTARDSSPGRAQ
jgi:hypothetical protein